MKLPLDALTPVQGRRSAFALPAALGLATVILLAGVMGAQVTSAGRRNIEVVRANRWVRMAAASAFDETCGSLSMWSSGKVPPLTDPTAGSRDLGALPGLTWPTSFPVPLATTTYRPESIELADVTFKTGPWTVQNSGGSSMKVYEVGIVEMSVIVKVKRPGQVVSRKVTVQRYAGAAPMPDGSGFKVVVAPFDLYQEIGEVR